MRIFFLFLFFSVFTPLFANPAIWQGSFPKTDFNRHSIPYEEIFSGGPGRDGIPALHNPAMIAVSKDRHLSSKEPVLLVEINGKKRAYPLRYLIWHEIANDELGGVPIAVTFCPLCNSALVFDRRVGGTVLSFGVTGLLRHSDMVMYDHQSESWWQQAIGKGIVGKYDGTELRNISARQLPWAEIKKNHANALVMAEPDFSRQYGRNPYAGYDRSKTPFLYSGDPPPHGVPALARVVRVADKAWLLSDLARLGEIREGDVVIRWQAGMASALDERTISEGRDIGSIEVEDRNGNPLVHDVMFAFAFDAFYPNGKWMLR